VQGNATTSKWGGQDVREADQKAEARMYFSAPAAQLERFSNSCALSGSVQGGFFLRKKPLDIVPSVYSSWRTAINAGSDTSCGSGRVFRNL
jgi:hypothetical protein